MFLKIERKNERKKDRKKKMCKPTNFIAKLINIHQTALLAKKEKLIFQHIFLKVAILKWRIFLLIIFQHTQLFYKDQE